MAFDDVLSQDIKKYILSTTTSEPPLLATLREETLATTSLPQMLSGPVEGTLLNLLVKWSRAKTCLELGTFTGYSALYIAKDLPPDGQLITCENDATHAHIAQQYFNKSTYGHKIDLRLGQALDTIDTLQELHFDFIFIDADKANYPLYYDKLIPLLRSGGCMVVDNALWDGEVLAPADKRTLAIDTLNKKAHHDPRVETVMLSVRDGILLIYKV